MEATPLAIACRSGFEDIAGLLVKHGAKVNYMCSVSNFNDSKRKYEWENENIINVEDSSTHSLYNTIVKK